MSRGQGRDPRIWEDDAEGGRVGKLRGREALRQGSFEAVKLYVKVKGRGGWESEGEERERE